MWFFRRRGRTGRFYRSALLMGLALLLGAIFSLLQTHQGVHAVIACRGDPIVTLSDNTQIQLTSDFDIETDSVNQVAYTLHAPKGLSVASVQWTGDLEGKETLNFIADQDGNHYTASTLATTSQPANVTVSMLAITTDGTTLKKDAHLSNIAHGHDKQKINTQVSW